MRLYCHKRSGYVLQLEGRCKSKKIFKKLLIVALTLHINAFLIVFRYEEYLYSLVIIITCI